MMRKYLCLVFVSVVGFWTVHKVHSAASRRFESIIVQLCWLLGWPYDDCTVTNSFIHVTNWLFVWIIDIRVTVSAAVTFGSKTLVRNVFACSVYLNCWLLLLTFPDFLQIPRDVVIALEWTPLQFSVFLRWTPVFPVYLPSVLPVPRRSPCRALTVQSDVSRCWYGSRQRNSIRNSTLSLCW